MVLLTQVPEPAERQWDATKAIESAVTRHITRFLLELGAGFAFVGRQVLLHVGGQDFYNKVVAEHALRGIHKPMGVAEYRLTESIPADLRGSLPSIEELEAALQASGDEDDA